MEALTEMGVNLIQDPNDNLSYTKVEHVTNFTLYFTLLYINMISNKLYVFYNKPFNLPNTPYVCGLFER